MKNSSLTESQQKYLIETILEPTLDSLHVYLSEQLDNLERHLQYVVHPDTKRDAFDEWISKFYEAYPAEDHPAVNGFKYQLEILFDLTHKDVDRFVSLKLELFGFTQHLIGTMPEAERSRTDCAPLETRVLFSFEDRCDELEQEKYELLKSWMEHAAEVVRVHTYNFIDAKIAEQQPPQKSPPRERVVGRSF